MIQATKPDIPGFQKFLLPILQLAGDGQEHTMKETVEKIAEHFQLSAEQRQLKNSKTGQLKFDNRVHWAVFYLRKTGLFKTVRPGAFQITDLGLTELTKNHAQINLAYLKQFEGFPGAKGESGDRKPELPFEEDEDLEPPEGEIPGGTIISEIEWEANANQNIQKYLAWLRASYGDKLRYEFTIRLGRTGNKYYGCNVWLEDQPIEHFRNDYQDKISVVIANFTREDLQTLKEKLAFPKDSYELRSAIYFPNTPNYRFTATDKDWKTLQELTNDIIERLQREDLDQTLIVVDSYTSPAFTLVKQRVDAIGLRLKDEMLERYHLALSIRGFVILAGVSGTGKTWLAQAYAEAIGAKHLLVPVAPNWTTNEDLLGYLNTLREPSEYVDTEFSLFLREAANEYEQATAKGLNPRPYHLILDEMNLARVEYYFAKFLSVMEVRARQFGKGQGAGPKAEIILGGNYSVPLTPNLYFIGTVNVDETTHGFADKVYDRAQLLILEADRDTLAAHLGNVPYQELVLSVWDIVQPVAPFAFRVIDELKLYIARSSELGRSWQAALDDQLLQKILPRLKGDGPKVGTALVELEKLLVGKGLERTLKKVRVMREGFNSYGFASYF